MDPVRGVERSVEDHLTRIGAMLGSAAAPYALVGATALLLRGIALPRTTRDLDLAVSVAGGLEGIRSLFEAGGFRSTTVRHRFATEDGMEIDVLPIAAGDLAERIVLPDGEWISSVGLAEAIESATAISLRAGSVRVAQLPVLAAIKLYVATVRVGEKDLDDALAVLRQYEAVGGRRFDVDYSTAQGLTWETAGAWLAGRDARIALQSRSRETVVAAAERLADGSGMSDRFAHGPESRELLAAFRCGLMTAE